MRRGLRSLAALAILLAAAVAPAAALADPSGQISGTVTDANGPVEDAPVVFSEDGNAVGSTQTGQDGTYTSPALPVGAYTVQFQPPSGVNLAPQLWHDVTNQGDATPVGVSDGATTTGIDATLAAGASLAGTVTDRATGAGLDQVGVEVDDANGLDVGDAQTASDGTYAIDQLPAGAYTVHFYPYSSSVRGDHYPVDAPDPATLTLTAGQARPGIDAALHEYGRVTGTVTDANGAVAGAAVKLFYADGSPGPGVSTASDGTYAFSGLQPGSYRVGFTPPSGSTDAPAFYDARTTLADARPISVALDTTTSGIDGALPAGATISGRIYDAAQPTGICAFVDVYLLRPDGSQVASTALGACGTNRPDGSYAFDNLPAGRYIVHAVPEHLGVGRYANADLEDFTGDAATLAAATPIALSAGQAVTGSDLTLPTGATITGTITKGAGVGWWSYPAGLVDCIPLVTLSTAGGTAVRTIEPDVDFTQPIVAGLPTVTYTAQGLPTGSYTIRVTCNDPYNNVIYRPAFYPAAATAADATPVAVTAPDTAAGRDVTLALAAGVEGRVTDAAGQPLAGIVLAAQDANGTPGTVAGQGTGRQGAFTQTDADGRYALALSAGAWVVSATDPDGAHLPAFLGGPSRAPVVLTAGAPLRDGADVRLAAAPSGGTITGTVRGLAGPLAGIQVTAYDAQGAVGAQAVTAADGTYALPGLAPGLWRVGFSDPTGAHVARFSDDEPSLDAADPVEVTADGATASGVDAFLAAVPGAAGPGGGAAPVPPAAPVYPAPVDSPLGAPGTAGLLAAMAVVGSGSPVGFVVPASLHPDGRRRVAIVLLCAGSGGCTATLTLRGRGGATLASRTVHVREGRRTTTLTLRHRPARGSTRAVRLSLTAARRVVQRADLTLRG